MQAMLDGIRRKAKSTEEKLADLNRRNPCLCDKYVFARGSHDPGRAHLYRKSRQINGDVEYIMHMAIFEGESYSEEEFERDYMIVSPIQDGSICDACWREWQRQMRENE